LKRWKAVLSFVLVCAGVAALGGWLYSRQALFRVTSIEVRLGDGPLKKTLEESLVVYSGRSMFALQLSELEHELLKHPEVASARILRRWPNALIIEAELKKKAALEFADKSLWIVDSQGEKIAKMQVAEALPLLWGFEKNPAMKAGVLSWIFAARNEDEMLASVDEIVFNEGVMLGFKNLGLRVNIGLRNWAQHWARAKSVFVAMQKQGKLALTIDSSIEGRVFVYDSVELHNSQSGLNLRELVRRTRDFRAEAR
jgi:hypothetical protein